MYINISECSTSWGVSLITWNFFVNFICIYCPLLIFFSIYLICIWALQLRRREMNHLSCAKLPESGFLIQSFNAVNQFGAIRKEKKKKPANPRPNWSSVNAVGLSPVATIQHLTSVLSISLCQRPRIESLQLETLGNDWAKSPTHLQHSLISWERGVCVCECKSTGTPTRFITRQLIHYFKLFFP